MGFEFGTFTDRFEKLEEALQIIVPMLRGERPSLEGAHYQATDVINSPAPLSRVPVMIGGSGEKKTLRMVAQYADESNLICDPAEVHRKLDALAAHCERLGRDRAEITVSLQRNVIIAETYDAAFDAARRFFGERGMDLDALDADRLQGVLGMMVLGDPDHVGQQLSDALATGIDGFTCNLVANGHEIEPVELLGEVLTKVVS